MRISAEYVCEEEEEISGIASNYCLTRRIVRSHISCM